MVTLSLGGATGGVGFQSDSQATSFADTLWNLFFAGKSETRPFGSAVMDGIDLDIEGGGSNCKAQLYFYLFTFNLYLYYYY